MKYAFIQANKHWPVSVLCAVLDVSPKGYWAHQQRRHTGYGSSRLSNDFLLTHIKAIFNEVKGEYGAPRVHKELLVRGIRVSRERVRKLMQSHGIAARRKQRWVATTDSKHSLPIAPNLLGRNFQAASPNQVWTTDITYIATNEGWQYLVVFLDLFNRQVVGWSMQAHMQAEMVVDALRMAYFRRRPAKGLIVHSDRGSQYCGKLFQDTLKAYGMVSSMSRKGDCWDNAPTESLWSSLKFARIHGKTFANGRQAKDEVMDWLAFYNAKRLHSTLGYLSPMQLEAQWRAKQPLLAA